jgi:hypothetical protein
MAPVERSVLPDGRDGMVILVVQHGGRGWHRLVLAADDPVATEAAIKDRAAAHGLRTDSEKPAAPRRLTASIPLCGAAVMAVLLLSAVHLIHF